MMKQENHNQQIRTKSLLSGYGPIIGGAVCGLFLGLVIGAILDKTIIGIGIGIGCGLLTGAMTVFRWHLWLRILIGAVMAVLVVAFLMKPITVLYQREFAKKISRDYLIEDVRQLAQILEDAHPDPYFHGGGKIAFHRRMQNIIRSIPSDGLATTDFYRLLCPFVAAVGDGHTSLNPPYSLRPESPGGISLYFKVVEKKFYVGEVGDSTYRNLIGSVLISVEGIDVGELMQRQGRMKGCDNEYQVMRNLGYDGSLWYRDFLIQLLPEWKKRDSIRIALRDPSDTQKELILPLNMRTTYPLIGSASSLELPSTKKSNYVYKFLDSQKKTILLLMENMNTYRETFEMGRALGGEHQTNLAKRLYEQFNEKTAPKDYSKMIAGIPSATELFLELVRVMKVNGTENLIIDLRRNQGGNAFISTMFYYFLYGKERLIAFSQSKSILIKKFSKYFWDTYPAWNLDDINKHEPIELLNNDYDFSGHPEPGHQFSREESIRMIEEEAVLTPTFWKEYQSGEFAGYYRPRNIVILCTPITTSSAYAFMYDHYTAGALVVGTPSSQAGNNFGAWLGFKLGNSGLHGGVSHLYVTHFRDDPEMGRVFRPHYELTYDKLKSYNFDPNAEVLYALGILQNKESLLSKQ
jgi:hypothetical protein